MFRLITLFCTILFFSSSGFAQRISREIRWPVDSIAKANYQYKASEKVGYNEHLWFEEKIHYPDVETMLPFYADLVPIPNSVTDTDQLSLSLSEVRFDLLSSVEQQVIGGLKPQVISEQQPIYTVHKSRGETYLQFAIPTLRLNPSTGRVEKMIGFDLQVDVISHESYAKGVERKTASQSVLSSGKWYMLSVSATGVHRIGYDELLGMGLSNLENVSIWGHDGKQLPFWNNEPSLDDLVQIPVWVDKGTDGVFNKGDYIYFFTNGPSTWIYNEEDDFFEHKIHDYATTIKYFVTTSRPNPLRVSEQSGAVGNPTRVSSEYDALVFFERNDTNLIKSGRQWFGESFDVYTSRSFNTGLNSPVANGTAKVRLRAAARSSVASSYNLKANGSSVGGLPIASVNTASQYTNFAAENIQTYTFGYSQGELQLELSYNKPTPAAKGWLDYITVNARQQLQMGSTQLLFRDVKSVGTNEITQFSISNTPQNLVVWDITNFFSPKNLEVTTSGGVSSIRVETDMLREFVAFTPPQAFSVRFEGEVPNQNIHAELQPDMVIVAHPDFISQAQELAQIHSNHSGLKSLVVTSQQVYNEYSSGNPDVSAIRNMMRMFYQRSTSEVDMPKYLLLFGDGSYDNRGVSPQNTNFIPTFQSENSLHVTSSFVSDDFFGLLDENEGEATGLLDLGIGRIPCSSQPEADVAVRKIRNYLSPASQGAWNNQLCFIGDDGDGNLHMRDADLHAQYVEENHPQYNIDKIYFDAFPLESMSSGDRYPGVTNAINNRANQGALIMNYVGHANARWLAHEQVIMVNDIQGWRNFDKLSLFVTATCEYSRFDDFAYKSAGEHTLFSPLGGSVALVSTSRVVYANPNFTLNRNFIHYVFAERESTLPSDIGKHYRLGDVVRLTKVATSGQVNKRNFMLLGDPALQLHYASNPVDITKINGVDVGNDLDTLRALSKVEIVGQIANPKNDSSVMGEVEFTLYDKAKTVTTLANRGGVPFVYTTRENSIYRGRSSLADGAFSATFIVPKDIMYGYGNGRFSLFAKGASSPSSGVFEDFIVGGIGQDAGLDKEGPTINIFMNTDRFVSGGITDQNPKLLVHLFDSSGINTTGVGIGHDLTATLIGENEQTYVLNDYYVADIDSYQKGKAEYQLSGLKPGPHKLRVKAWDVYNNSAVSEIDFTVQLDDELTLKHILNYPNPFTESTAFYFEYNRPYEDSDIIIQIFSPSGRLVKTISHFAPGDGSYRIGPIAWDGLDDFGDRIGRGVYFYRLTVRLGNGQTAQAYQKLVILK